MRPHVESVTSTIKGGVNAKLGKKTLILGPNGIGKSAIVNAVELAGTGKASDIAGRDLLAKDADLAMLCPPGESHVIARAVLSNGQGMAAWELTKGKRARRTGPEIAFPLRDVQAALLGSPETARKWVLQHGAPFTWSDVVLMVPTSLRSRLELVADNVAGRMNMETREPTAAAKLTAALEEAKRCVREDTAKAKAARSLSSPSQPPPEPRAISALEAVIDAWKIRGIQGTFDASALAVLTQAIETRKEEISSLEGRAAELESELSDLPVPQGNLDVLRAALLVVETLSQVPGAMCPICARPAPADLALKAQAGRQRIAQVSEVADKRKTLFGYHQRTINELSSARRQLEALVTEQARAERAPKDDRVLPAMSREEAETRLRSLRVLEAGWEASKRSEEKALEAEREAGEWSQLSESLSQALKVLVGRAREGFVAKVQRFLPRLDVFGLELLDGEREVLRMGLVRSGALHAALSGAEWARVTAALALATAPTVGPVVVCPEERAFDRNTLTVVLEAFGDALDAQGERAPQVIITSPNAPRKVPTGWTVVELGEVGRFELAIPAADRPPPAKGGPQDYESIFDS